MRTTPRRARTVPRSTAPRLRRASPQRVTPRPNAARSTPPNGATHRRTESRRAAPHRVAPRSTAPRRAAQHRTASRRAGPHRVAPRSTASRCPGTPCRRAEASWSPPRREESCSACALRTEAAEPQQAERSQANQAGASRAEPSQARLTRRRQRFELPWTRARGATDPDSGSAAMPSSSGPAPERAARGHAPCADQPSASGDPVAIAFRTAGAGMRHRDRRVPRRCARSRVALPSSRGTARRQPVRPAPTRRSRARRRRSAGLAARWCRCRRECSVPCASWQSLRCCRRVAAARSVAGSR